MGAWYETCWPRDYGDGGAQLRTASAGQSCPGGAHRLRDFDWGTDVAVVLQGHGIATGKPPSRHPSHGKSFASRSSRCRPGARSPRAGHRLRVRDEADARSFAVNRASRHRRIPDVKEWQELVSDHRELVEKPMAFVPQWARLLRLPVDAELATAPQAEQERHRGSTGPARAAGAEREAGR